ncbi:hypothetical protein P3T36_000024 [Kitasatospora sp. MAP12-15]|uniref:M23 family metallopeptidase n=1 Tax=unclassified Kitasatospora TaxID=2633591 RepID=UPI0024769C0F|nr:M23 family metallopeptidase [Kitasatospora sp. MAP12-44]MDH6109252.1 hypothetical protein [Kitasatospora sp. MAP12-44]
MPAPDRQAQAAALKTFLIADPAQWPELAPQVLAAVGADRLRSIAEATRARVGGVREVVDTRAGLAVTGPAGRVLAWVQLDADGRLTALRIAPATAGRRELPIGLLRWCGRAFWLLLFGWSVFSSWTASDLTGWIDAALTTAFGLLLLEGWSMAAAETWWFRRPLELSALVTLASAYRLPGLPTGHDLTGPTFTAVLLVANAVSLVRARRHRWRETTAVPLRFPLRGSWYVAQGGGRGLNHHFGIAEQRGAVDLVRVGPGGTRGRSQHLESYHCYGEKLYAPCAGRVVAAVDGFEDQQPGVIRYGPLYGNHVFIDTGDAIVKLAHLRPGTVAVTEGQQIEAGCLLGEVGNSGNTSEPHLHLHAERDGQGLDLRFTGVTGGLYRGRTVRG